MRLFSLTVLSCLATSTAFTTVPLQCTTISASQSNILSLRMVSNEFAKTEIDSNDVVVFSKSYCPFCDQTKELLKKMNVKFAVHELDQMGDDGVEIQTSLLDMTGQRSVPNVFVKQQHIGGNDDTQLAAKEGKLQKLLGIK
mmetsp:Transcript_34211/g.38231  ORF Transcript_34211/g.38231 Transcript_34211/m.38231 type:complete len:141 (+) Transcript_34211:65-487(+)